jgi:hypothetical protein
MIQQTPTDTYIKICMKAWLLCESCVHAETSSPNPRFDLVLECTHCAKICFAVVSKLVSNSDDLGDLVLNCLLHCRQCAETCEQYKNDNDVQLCGDVCAACADTLKELVPVQLN